MAITGTAIAFASIIFQTVTHNRLLTPSMIGVDSMYEVVQTIIFFFAGTASIFVVNRYLNFGASIIAMILFALLLYRFLFRADKYPIFLEHFFHNMELEPHMFHNPHPHLQPSRYFPKNPTLLLYMA